MLIREKIMTVNQLLEANEIAKKATFINKV